MEHILFLINIRVRMITSPLQLPARLQDVR